MQEKSLRDDGTARGQTFKIKIMKFWHKATNWQKTKDTVQGVAATLQFVFALTDSDHIWNYMTFAVQVVTLLITIWGEDKDLDGRVDVFQEEVKVIVKSDSPVDVEVTKEEIKPK